MRRESLLINAIAVMVSEKWGRGRKRFPMLDGMKENEMYVHTKRLVGDREKW